MTCTRTQEFLARHKLTPIEQVNARTTPLKRSDALALAGKVDRVIAMKGKRVTNIDLKRDRLDQELLLGYLLGPTGNLRAPTLRSGRTLLVGFDLTTFEGYFC